MARAPKYTRYAAPIHFTAKNRRYDETSSAPIPVADNAKYNVFAVNIARITATGLLHATGRPLLAGWFFHDLAGWLMMPLALLLLGGAGWGAASFPRVDRSRFFDQDQIIGGWLDQAPQRALLLQPDGAPTARGHAILAHTPAGRFGEPDDLVATAVWLSGPGAAFVTGVVVPVDGGFDAFSGV